MIAPRKHSAVLTLLIISAFLTGACSNPNFSTETTVDGATSIAPSAAAAKQEQKTIIRFLNASEGLKDLYFRDKPAFTKVQYGRVTSYTALPSPRPDAHHELKLYNSSSEVGTPLSSNAEVGNYGGRYTILALNYKGKPRLTVIPDQLKPPALGKTKLRLIHAAPGVDKMDIFPSGETNGIFSGQSFPQITEYKEIAPVTTELAVRKRGSTTDEVKLKDVELKAGKLYTIILLGGEGKPLACKVIEDELVSASELP